jgi:protein arginine kinase
LFEAGDMLDNPAAWLNASGDESEVIMSSRVRIARNLHRHRFAHNCDNGELSDILTESSRAAGETDTFKDSRFVGMGEISTLDRQFLAERHLVSRELLVNSVSRGLVVNGTEDVCLMINEEDHLRLQAYGSGLDLQRTYGKASRLDNELTSGLEIAFNERYGYLTACPTNVGTGMRASVLIHLPGLVHSKEINKLLESLSKLNHTMRGFYGEGSEVMGNFFQLSNSATLGMSEEDIVRGLREMATKVVGFERKAREMLFSKARSLLEDKVWRAYGLLRYAHSVSTKEALSLISAVRLGVGVGIIKDVSIKTLNHLLVYTQPSHLQRLNEMTMDAQERDVARAEYIRDALTGAQSGGEG